MLEGKVYRNIDMVFIFVAGFIDNVTGFQDEQLLTETTTILSDIMLSLIYDHEREGWSQ